jgi:DNA-binding GntR family transcriptional regulator
MSDATLLADRVFAELERRIVLNVLEPGSHLAEQLLAKDLGVSRTPVREAIARLRKAGLVDIHPGTGAFVHRPTPQEIRDLFEVREASGRLAAELAAVRSSDSDLRTLRRFVKDGQEAAQYGELDAVSSLNTEFHAAVAAATTNGLLHEIDCDLSTRVRWVFSSVAARLGRGTWDEHEELVVAIEARDPVRAGALMVSHCRATRDAYLEMIGLSAARPEARAASGSATG